MKKLNNKGLTAIEVLVCFTIVSIIVISMLNVVNNYKDKQTTESYKTSITTYKNTLTKIINKDIINNKGVISASSTQVNGDTTINIDEVNKNNYFVYTLNLKYRTGKTATIEVHNESKCLKYKRDGNGKKVVEANNLDCTENGASDIDYDNSKYYVKFIDSNSNEEKFSLPKIYYLQFNDPDADLKDTNFIEIHIGLWHPDLGTKYDALNIITPDVSKYPGMLGY